METFLIAFVGTFVAGFAIGMLSDYFESRYKPPNVVNSKKGASIYGKSSFVRVSSGALLTGWATSILMIVGIIFSSLTDSEPDAKYVFVIPMSIIAACVLLNITFGFKLKCDECSKRVLFQESENQPFVKKGWYWDGRFSVAIQALFRNSFQCMSCGKKYVIK